MDEPRKGMCSVCKAPATYYGGTTQYCISDYKKLRTENQRLREALEKVGTCTCHTTGFAGRCVKHEALAETEGE
jgi:hypothetical protein